MKKFSFGFNKIRKSGHIFALKVRTESNGLGVLKTFIVLLLIALQGLLLIFSYTYFLQTFKWYFIFSLCISILCCIYVMSSDYNGQAKSLWVMFLISCFSFAYIIYFLSDKHILFAKSRMKYNRIYDKIKDLQPTPDFSVITDNKAKASCKYLYNAGQFVFHINSRAKYFSSGVQLFDDILQELNNASSFIFIEYYIIAEGILFDRIFNILEQKVKQGVDVRIIYDDMGSHGTLKRKTKKKILSLGIKLEAYNRLVPIFNIALNLRDHRKLVIIDGKVAYTGGANLADEYINEKRLHGYWKDSGIKIEGLAVDNFTISFLTQWQFITKKDVDFIPFLYRGEKFEDNGIIVPFVSGPNYLYSIAQNIYLSEIANATEKIYIMTPYFVPDETITNLIINKARAGVDIKIILPEIADKKFVYIVSRNNAEKLMQYGVKLYTMSTSFVHSKVLLTENSAIIGSINMDLRSFNQQFEIAVYVNNSSILQDVNIDFDNTLQHSKWIKDKNKKRNKLYFRLLAGLFNLISPFM